MVDIFKEINYLKDIKSFYVTKEIFLYLNEKQRLNLIRYNNQLQKFFRVDISYYRKKCDKYIIFLDNGRMKLYDSKTNELLYDGECLNGKRNGKGEEYRNGKVIFEGEYLNEKRNGKGKEYYDNERIKFEGEYLNGKIWNGKGYNKNSEFQFRIKGGRGFVKEYYENGRLKFTGDYSNGTRNGKGKEYNYDGRVIFEGEYSNGERNGKGRIYYFGKLLFEGEFLNGEKWNGNIYDDKGDVYSKIREGINYC